MKLPSSYELAEMPYAERMPLIVGAWRETGLAEVEAMMPEAQTFDIGGRRVRAVVLGPRDDREIDTTTTIVRSNEFQQGYTPVQFIGAEITRQAVNPNGRLVMFPNNMLRQSDHRISRSLFPEVRERGLAVLAEDKMRVLEMLGLERIDTTGWSQGARMAIALAEVGSDKIEIGRVNADEPPSAEGRTPKQLKKDFMKSGGWGEQRGAIADAGIPALSEAFSAVRLGVDYSKFGVASLLPSNSEVMATMAGDIDSSLELARRNYPDIRVKLGQVVGSRIFQPTARTRELVEEIVRYDGVSSHRHATSNNPFAQANMASHGLL